MNFIDVINNRRTVRDFSGKKIPFEIVEKALEAGLKAPSYNHLRDWDFILVKDEHVRFALTETEEMIEQVTDKLKENFKTHDVLAQKMYLDAIPKQKKMIISAPELLVVIYKPKTKVVESKRIYDMNCLASIWCCIENILLSLSEDNVFGVTFIPKNTDLVKKILNVSEELEVAAFIPFGYKDEKAVTIPQKVVDLKSKLHIDKL